MSYSDAEIQQGEGCEGHFQTAIICTAVVLSALYSHQAGNTACAGYLLPLSCLATVVIGLSPSLSLRQRREYGGGQVGGGWEGKGPNHNSCSSDQSRTRCFLTQIPACPCLLEQGYLRRHTSEHTV